jgi:hypothetical protein
MTTPHTLRPLCPRSARPRMRRGPRQDEYQPRSDNPVPQAIYSKASAAPATPAKAMPGLAKGAAAPSAAAFEAEMALSAALVNEGGSVAVAVWSAQ